MTGTWELLQAARQRADALDDDDGGTPEAFYAAERERERLQDRLTIERAAELPRLPCCDDGSRHILPCDLPIQCDDGTWNTRMAWVIDSAERVFEPHKIVGGHIRIAFCPFCGTPTPPFRRKDPPPPHVHQPISDGDHCGGCESRSRSCICSYPESTWEPDV